MFVVPLINHLFCRYAHTTFGGIDSNDNKMKDHDSVMSFPILKSFDYNLK